MASLYKSFICSECGSQVVQTPRGRPQGCEHHPPGNWGWKATMSIGTSKSKKQQTDEERRAMERRREIEEICDKFRLDNELKEVWDE